jgi:hypothetical protein
MEPLVKEPAMPGNALHKLFAFSQPHVKHVVTAAFNEISEEAVFEVPGVHREAVLHIYRQAIEISFGRQADDVTALLVPEIGSEAGTSSRTE